MSDEKEKKTEAEQVKLGLKDYVALSIAALETFLLPLVVLAAVIAAVALLLNLWP